MSASFFAPKILSDSALLKEQRCFSLKTAEAGTQALH